MSPEGTRERVAWPQGSKKPSQVHLESSNLRDREEAGEKSHHQEKAGGI